MDNNSKLLRPRRSSSLRPQPPPPPPPRHPLPLFDALAGNGTCFGIPGTVAEGGSPVGPTCRQHWRSPPEGLCSVEERFARRREVRPRFGQREKQGRGECARAHSAVARRPCFFSHSRDGPTGPALGATLPPTNALHTHDLALHKAKNLPSSAAKTLYSKKADR